MAWTHLLPLRGTEALCGARTPPAPADADINVVSCQLCWLAHEALTEEEDCHATSDR